MKKILLLSIITITFFACKEPVKPQLKVVEQNVSTITLYKSKLKIPSNLQQSIFIKKIISPSKFENGTFNIKKNTKKNLTETSFWAYYDFNKSYTIKSVDLKKLGTFKKIFLFSTVNKEDINEISFAYDGGASVIKELKRSQSKINKFPKTPTQDVNISLLSVKNPTFLEEGSNIVAEKKNLILEFTFYDSSYEKEIILYNLEHSDNKELNEKLIVSIASLNRKLFKSLGIRKNEKKAKIIKHPSIANLPDDADIDYTLTHQEDFYSLGKYRTKDGSFKILIKDDNLKLSTEDLNFKKHNIKVDKNSKKMKTTTDIPESDDFIDFSEGLK